jgi:hypothetical protein
MLPPITLALILILAVIALIALGEELYKGFRAIHKRRKEMQTRGQPARGDLNRPPFYLADRPIPYRALREPKRPP